MKRIRYISIFVLALISQVLAISIDFYDEQQNNSAIVGIRIRINNDTLESINTQGLFVLGEGAGYSGGIVTSAADGIRLAVRAKISD